MDDYIKSLLKDFFEEAFEMLDRLEENILILDKDRDNVVVFGYRFVVMWINQ